MTILSLKGILLHQFHRVLLSERGIHIAGFTEPLYGTRRLAYASSQLNPTQPFDNGINWQEIPLTKARDIGSVLYTSALPQKLAKQIGLKWGLTPTEISHRISQWLDQAHQEPFNDLCVPDHKDFDLMARQLWFEFEIAIQPPGCIAFCLSNRGIALWLQHAQHDLHRLYEDSCPENGQPLSQNEIDPSSLWQMQYAHARCCTLLALWQTSQAHQSPPDLPWASEIYPLSASTPQAQRLIQSLIYTADDMFWIPYHRPDRQYVLLLKRAALLCQSFDQFYRGCLYGFSQLSPTAAPSERLRFKASFGLVAATRNVLKVLLYRHFHAESPTSL